jgi:serine/threonine-protein kinase
MQTIGRYELVEKLGQGGMGVVYRAFDPLLQRVVALKLIATLEADQELRERFFREARAAGQLSHKNIITIYDLGEHEGQPFLAMEYLEGQDLQQRMTSPAAMSLARKLELAIEICEGLEYAHLHGVIHRDIKPANIFITNGGIAKILDFGLARLITSELTNSNMMMGTLNYMAPEQVRGERADHRSDIFSAGVVLYEVLGGRRAFEGDSFGATLYKILEEVPVPLRELDENLPPELIAIVERAIEKPRETRYQHMGEMLRDLVAYRQHLLITNSPAFGSMAPMSAANATTASNAPTMAAPASPRPFRAPSDRASAATTGRPATPAAVRTPPAAPRSAEGSRTRMVAGAAALVIVLGAGATWMLTRNEADPAEMASAANPPQSAAADPAAEAARQKAEAIERGLSTARDQLAAGQYEAAATAAGEVLALEPGNNDARRIMDDASRSRGKGTTEARERMTSARNAAVAAAAQTLAPAQFKAAQAAQREGLDLLERGQQGEAAAKFWEASGLFRSAEVAAHTEAATRRERARAQAERASPDRSKEAAAPPEPPAPKPPPTSTITVPTTTGLQLPPGTVPSAPPVTAPPPPRNPPIDKPAPAEPPPPSPTEQITALLDRYAAALESRSLDALKRIWPGLSGAQESAMRYEFQNARLIEVEVVSPQISVREDSATVTFTRRYRNVTADGQDLRRDSSATMTVRRAGNAWVIEQLRFAPAR